MEWLVAALVLLLAGVIVWPLARALMGHRRAGFEEVLARQGLTVADVVSVVGVTGLARAVHRCARCQQEAPCNPALGCTNDAVMGAAAARRDSLTPVPIKRFV